MKGHAVNSRTVALTASAAALPDQDCESALLQSDPDNSEDIFIGDADGQHLQLNPGVSFSLEISNLSQLQARAATSAATLNILSLL